MGRNLNEILLGLQEAYLKSKSQSDTFLLQNFINLYCGISNTQNNILTEIYMLYAQENGYNQLEFSNIFLKDIALIKQEVGDKFWIFLIFAIVSVIENIVYFFKTNLGSQHNILQIETKFYNILNLTFCDDGIEIRVKNRSDIIKYDKIYNYIKEKKSTKDLYYDLSSNMMSYAEKILQENEKFINSIKNKNFQIDVADFTDDENIINHQNEIDELDKILKKLPDMRIIDEIVENVSVYDFIERLSNDFIKAKNLALASLIVGQPQYDLNEFRSAIQLLRQVVNF